MHYRLHKHYILKLVVFINESFQMSWCILVWNSVAWIIQFRQRFFVVKRGLKKEPNWKLSQVFEYSVCLDIWILIYCIDLTEGVKDSFRTFRNNSKGDIDKTIKLTDVKLMVKNEIHKSDISYQFPKQETARKVWGITCYIYSGKKQPLLGATRIYRHYGTRYWTGNL